MQATALAEAQARLRAARSHTAEDYNMLKLTMEAKRNEMLHVLFTEHRAYTKATETRAQVLLCLLPGHECTADEATMRP